MSLYLFSRGSAPQHPHGGHNCVIYAVNMRGVYVHFQYNVHCPSRCAQYLDQRRRSWMLEHLCMMLRRTYSSHWQRNCLMKNIPFTEKPSCLQTTLASELSQKSSHTVPHWFPMKISTLPSLLLCPPTRRMGAPWQPGKMKMITQNQLWRNYI